MVALPSRVLVIADYDKPHFEEHLGGGLDFVLSLGNVPFNILQEIYDLFLRPIYAVKGCHDPPTPFPSCVEDVHRKIVQHRKWVIGGYQGIRSDKPEGAYQWEDAQAGFELNHFPYVDVFIAHAPVYQITDTSGNGHEGSQALRRYIEDKQPRYVYHGHVHSEIGAMVGESAVVSVFGAKLVTLR
ncbi:MAG: hypothetical protein ACERK6_04305 [Candidatus Aminicenantaceae bacterium]